MKDWHAEIEFHIREWSARLDAARKWWPTFVYHFTDVRNAVRILREGAVLSRKGAGDRGLIACNGASPTVIHSTPAKYLEFVRLYFRPGTPTQFRNEGIRPIGQRWRPDPLQPSAHCPVPVFFCFDAARVLGMDATAFSDGNLASPRSDQGTSRDSFRRIPFEHVFHQGPIPPGDPFNIKNHRHAEVLVPDRLDLTGNLKHIVCRSSAERQTLLHLLPKELQAYWEPRVRLGYEGLFHRRWTYVESVSAFTGVVTFNLNPNTETPGPFRVRFRIAESSSNRVFIWEGDVASLRTHLAFRLRSNQALFDGVATLVLDGCLAFEGFVTLEDIPF